MNFNGKYYPWLTGAAIVALILGAAYYIGTRTGKAKKEGAADDVLKKAINNNELTFEQTQYVALAAKLETAMFGYSDDENAVYAVFTKLRTKSDVLNLIKTFGERRMIFTLGNANLNQWINTRLDTSEIAKVNDILSRNNIDYQF
jgi:hypothetical protein